MNEKTIVRKLIDWLIRDEISVKRRLLNVVMAAVIAVQIPCFIFSAIIYRSIISVSIPLIAIATMALGLLFANGKNSKRFSAVVLISIVDYVVLPICYYWDGGKNSSDDLWIMAGLIVIFLLVEGNVKWIMALVDCLLIAGMFYFEYAYPQLMHPLGNEKTRIAEMIISMAVIGLSFGAVFSFQTYLYEKQARELLEKEEHLKETMNALENANNAKSDFLAKMSHEIRTPINAVLGMNEMILRESREDKTLQYAYNVDSAGRTLLSLVNDILDFSKIDSGKLEIQSLEYNVTTLVSNCYNMIAQRAQEKKLDFVISNNPDMPTGLKGDEIRVRQIIINLLTNAVKYTVKGSVTLNLDYEKIGENRINLLISVKDTGLGIKEEDKPMLFNKFARTEEGDRNIEGTGLGLAIIQNLLELMGGSISVESTYNEGSTFYVTIPQGMADATPAGNLSDSIYTNIKETSRKYTNLFKAPKARILSVDDVKVNNDVIRSLLKQTEMQVDCVYSGRECLNCLRNNEYDLILMDHMMPEIDGIETFKRIKKLDSPNAKIPVIVLTANAIVGAQNQYLREGFDDYISKPVDATQLEKTIFKHLPDRLIESTGPVDVEKVISQLQFLDTEAAIPRFKDSSDDYYEALKLFVGESCKEDELAKCFKDEKWEEYFIIIHNLKSSIRDIGADSLAVIADQLENAVMIFKLDLIKEKHYEFMTAYEKTIKDIKKAL